MYDQPPPSRRSAIWSFMTETRIGSVSPLGCIVQVLVVGIVMAVIAGVLTSVLR